MKYGRNKNAKESTTSLPRVLNLIDITSIVIGGIIGSGIFLVPTDIAAEVKSPLLMIAVWVVGGF
jgi:hypothetical protein